MLEVEREKSRAAIGDRHWLRCSLTQHVQSVVFISGPPTHALSPSLPLFPPSTMLKRQRPSSPLPIPAAYSDDLSPPTLGPNAFNMGTPSIQVDPSFGFSRKRPRVSPDVTPGATGAGGSGSVGRHMFFSSSMLSKRRRSPDPMDDDDADDKGDHDFGPDPQTSNTYLDYQRAGETSDPFASSPTINPKRRRTTAPVLEGSSRGWGSDQTSHFSTGPDLPAPISHLHLFDPAHPPPGWVLETQVGEYAQENAKLHDLHALRPRLPHLEDVTQEGHNEIVSVVVDVEEKVVKERYEEHNKYAAFPFYAYTLGCLTTCVRLLGSLFLERQRRLAGA